MNRFFHSRDDSELERRLRAGAGAFAPAPPSELRGRILSELRSAGAAPTRAPRALEAQRSDPRGSWIAAAAALLVLTSAWWLTRPAALAPGAQRSVVLRSRELLDAGARMWALPAQAEEDLRLEATRMLSDTTRVAQSLVRGLPAPVRARFESM